MYNYKEIKGEVVSIPENNADRVSGIIILGRRMIKTYDVVKLKLVNYYMKNYTYIIIDKQTNHAAIVDPSWQTEHIEKKLAELKVDLKYVLITHSHFDHIVSVNYFVKKYNSKVIISEQEQKYYNFQCKNQYTVIDEQTLILGETNITCLLTPGHTKGGMCYLLSESIFTGDTVFIEGCGICTGDGSSAEKMFDSFQKLKNIVDPDVHVYPGHKYEKEPGITFRNMQQYNIYMQLDNKKHFIDFRMRKNKKNMFMFK